MYAGWVSLRCVQPLQKTGRTGPVPYSKAWHRLLHLSHSAPGHTVSQALALYGRQALSMQQGTGLPDTTARVVVEPGWCRDQAAHGACQPSLDCAHCGKAPCIIPAAEPLQARID